MVREKSTARDRIMEAAEEVFAEKGYHAAAMDEIVRRTEISKGGLYFHFPSKERLFFAVIDHLADRLIQRIQRNIAHERDPLVRLDIALGTVLDSLSKRRRLAKLLLVQGYSMGNAFEKKRVEVFSRFAALLKEDLDAAAAQGAIQRVNTQILAHIWLGAINEVIVHWLYTRGPAPAAEALPLLRRVLLDSLALHREAPTGGN